jgi:hypothetical protein
MARLAIRRFRLRVFPINSTGVPCRVVRYFIVAISIRERVVKMRSTLSPKLKVWHVNLCARTRCLSSGQSVPYFMLGAISSLEATTKTAVAMSMTPMPMTLARSPNCCVIHPNVVIPAMAAVIAPVP